MLFCVVPHQPQPGRPVHPPHVVSPAQVFDALQELALTTQELHVPLLGPEKVPA